MGLRLSVIKKNQLKTLFSKKELTLKKLENLEQLGDEENRDDEIVDIDWD